MSLPILEARSRVRGPRLLSPLDWPLDVRDAMSVPEVRPRKRGQTRQTTAGTYSTNREEIKWEG